MDPKSGFPLATAREIATSPESRSVPPSAFASEHSLARPNALRESWSDRKSRLALTMRRRDLALLPALSFALCAAYVPPRAFAPIRLPARPVTLMSQSEMEWRRQQQKDVRKREPDATAPAAAEPAQTSGFPEPATGAGAAAAAAESCLFRRSRACVAGADRPPGPQAARPDGRRHSHGPSSGAQTAGRARAEHTARP